MPNIKLFHLISNLEPPFIFFNYKISSRMQVYSYNIIKWQKKQSSPQFSVPSPDVATWASYSPDSLAANLPSFTLFVMLQLGLWLCQYLPHCFTRWLPGRFYPGGGRRDFSVFLTPFSISPISGNLPQSPCSFWQLWNQLHGLLRSTVGQMGFP